MGVSIPVGYGLAAVEITGTKGTSPFVTTIGVDLGSAGGDYVEAANIVQSEFVLAFVSMMDEELTIQRTVLQVGQDGESASVVSTLSPATGSVSTASEAIAMAPCIYKLTNTLGRKGRGKSMIPGILRETNVGSQGTIDSSPKGSILAAYEAFLDGLENNGSNAFSLPPVLLHSPAVGMSPSPIVGAAVRDKVAWVRGRLF